MRLLLLYILVFLGFLHSNAQDWNWAENFGGDEGENIGAMKIDSEGSVFMVGSYKGMVDFGIATFEALEGSDAFLSKLNNQGEVEWAVSAGSFNNDVSIDVEIDAQGNLIWLGEFWIEAFFQNDTIVAGTNAKAYFVAKYDDSGNLIWVESIIGSALKVVSDLSLDDSGDIMITGYFSDSLQSGDLSLLAENETDAFLLKMSAEGESIWAKRYGDAGEIFPKKIEKNSNGDFVIAGDLIGGITIGEDTLVSVSTDFDIFVGLFSEDGTGLWGRIGTGVFDNLLNGLAIDQGDDIYLSGNFVGVMEIGDEEILTPGFNDNLYLLKMDASGDLLWGRALSAEVFNDPSFSLDIAVKEDQNLLMMIGQFKGDLLIDHLRINNENAVSGFVGGFDMESGIVKQLDKIRGTDQSSGLEIEVDTEGLIYISGVFFETVSFDDFDLMSSGGTDVFVAKANELLTSVYSEYLDKISLSVFPNPAQNQLILKTSFTEFEVTIYDVVGRTIFYTKNEKVLDIKNLKPGTYYLSFRNGKDKETVVFLKQ